MKRERWSRDYHRHMMPEWWIHSWIHSWIRPLIWYSSIPKCQSKRKPPYSGPMYHPSMISYHISTASSAFGVQKEKREKRKENHRAILKPSHSNSKILSPIINSQWWEFLSRGHSVTAVVNLWTALLLKKMYPCLSSDKLDFAINDSILGPYGTWESSMGRPVSWPCCSLPQSRHLQSSLRSCNPYSRSYAWRTHQPQRM